MVNFKVVIGTKEGKCVQKDIQEPESKIFLDKKIGDTINGDEIGLNGYEFMLMGGSDYCGFPMRKDVEGFSRKRILAVCGTGLKKKANGSSSWNKQKSSYGQPLKNGWIIRSLSGTSSVCSTFR